MDTRTAFLLNRRRLAPWSVRCRGDGRSPYVQRRKELLAAGNESTHTNGVQASTHSLSKDAGAKGRLAAVGKLPFAVIQNPKVAKVVQQFVMGEQVIGIFRMADHLLVD